MTNSSRQILLIGIVVALFTSAFVYYTTSGAPSEDTSMTANNPELSMGDQASETDDTTEEEAVTLDPMAETVACLEEKEVVIYGSRTCPACIQMVNLFKGYEVIDPIYVECQTEGLRCSQEMQTQYVPEVQIAGNVFQGPATPAAIAAAVGCNL